MENKKPSNDKVSNNTDNLLDSASSDIADSSLESKKNSNIIDKSESVTKLEAKPPQIQKKSTKPPKLEDKPFDEFINNYFIPGLKSSIEKKGILVSDIKLINGQRPVVGGNCWMVFCELSQQRRFWLCFNKDIITSDKTILLAESDSDPSIVESFLIDEKKTTLPLLISRVLQRLNGQKWIGVN
tara:strand:- start:868 stop:1419 length:552 start_codon:yes stop_codon:yes gene_type:complete